MKKINKILIVFLASISVLMLGVWRIVESQKFSRLVERETHELTKNIKGLNVKFEKVSFKVVPPGAMLKNIHLEYRDESMDINADIGKLFVSLSAFSPFHGKINLNVIELEQSKLNYISKKKSGKKFELSDIWTILSDLKYSELKKIINQSPINLNSVRISKTDILLDGTLLKINKLRATIGKILELKGDLDGINAEGKTILKTISLDAVATDNEIQLRKYTIDSGAITLKGSGEVEINNKRASGEGNVALNLTGVNIPEIKSGNIIGTYRLSIRDNLIRAKVNGNGHDIKTDYLNLKQASFKLDSLNYKLDISNVNAEFGKGRAKLLAPISLNISKGSLFPLKIDAEVNDVKTNDLLYYFKDSFEMLKGDVTGRFVLDIKSDKEVVVSIPSMTKVENLKLVSKKNETVLTLGLMKIITGSIVSKNKKTDIDLELNKDKSTIHVLGDIEDDIIDLDTNDFDFDFQWMNNKLSSIEMKGSGKTKLTVSGPLSSPIINFKLNHQKSEFLGFKFGNLIADIDYTIDDKIVIPSAKGKLGTSSYTLNGNYSFKKDAIDFKVNIPNGMYRDVLEMHLPITKNLNNLWDNINGPAQVKYRITGSPEIKNLVVSGDASFDELIVYRELIDSLNFKFSFEENKFSSTYRAKKMKSRLYGDVSYNLDQEKFLYTANLKSLKLTSLSKIQVSNYGIDGVVSADASGEMIRGEHASIKVEANLKNSNIVNTPVGDSYIDFEYTPKETNYKLTLLAGQIVSEGSLVKDGQDKFLSSRSVINLEDYRDIIKILYKQAKFETKEPLKLDLDFDYNNTKEILKNLKVTFFDETGSKGSTCATITNYVIDRFNCKIKLRDLGLSLSGGGVIPYQYKAIVDVDLNLLILQNMLPEIVDSKGILNIRTKYSSDVNNGPIVQLTSNDSYINSTFIPAPLKDLNIDMLYYRQDLKINKVSSRINKGTFEISGGIAFGKDATDVNLDYRINDANVDINSKTSSTLSAGGTVRGHGAPYYIDGVGTLKNTLVYNEFSDFSGTKKIDSPYKEFLPEVITQSILNDIKWRVDLSLETPLYIKNSMYDVAFNGNFKVLGSLNGPMLAGQLNSIPNTGKVIFKNNEYILNSGTVVFTDNHDMYDPIMKMHVSSLISNHRVNIFIDGRLSDYSMKLSSEPSLSEQGILSLIMFGYTDNLSYALSQEDRSNLSSVGVGAVIFDKFKVSSFLKESTGFQLNLGTDFTQDQRSMLSGANNRSDDMAGRFRSATKIELRRKLMDKLMLSVSSTVGGSVGQKQNMNLNYQLNTRTSIDGIYEVRTSEEGEENIIDRAMGGDLKWRWSFK